jgi:cell division transport system permease protein
LAILRALLYFVDEALTSLWRSRLMNTLSVSTIAVSLFVLGSFLLVASNLSGLVERWADRVQVAVYLRDDASEAQVAELAARLRAHPAVAQVEAVSKDVALTRFRSMFRELASLPDELGGSPFPASLEVTIRPEHQQAEAIRALVATVQGGPGVEEVHYDLLWVERLATAVRLVRGVGAFLGGILAVAGVFTISNVIRLTVYARQDELDIMRLVGATRAYVKGPFLVEGLIQGGLGGLLAVGMLWAALRWVERDILAGSTLVSPGSLHVTSDLVLLLVVGGMGVGLLGSVLSLGRSKV